MYWHDMGSWAWIPMSLGMLLFWGLVVWLIVRLTSGSSNRGAAAEPSTRQVLDARLARGEIGTSEYEALRRVLEGEAPPEGDARWERSDDDAQRVG